MTRTPSRRTVLTGLATGGLAAVAGCTSDDDPSAAGDGDSPADGTSSGPLRGITVEGYTLVITLREGADIDRVNVIAPDGSAVASREVVGGQTRLEVEIEWGYQHGEYDVRAVESGETAASTSVDLRPNLTVAGATVGTNAQEGPPEQLPYGEEQLRVTVENTGAGPAALTGLGITGDIPNPAPVSDSTSQIYDQSDGYGDADIVRIPAASSRAIWSTSQPFSFTGDGEQCSSSKTGVMSLRIQTRVAEIDARFDIEYTGSESRDNCRISVEGRL
jgi:hypothetical protein